VDPVACWFLGRFLHGETSRFTERPVQLFIQNRSNNSSSARLVMGRIGETVADFCRRFSVDLLNQQVILNGMLAGQDVDPDTARILTSTESVAIRPTVATELPSACLACGWCVDVCPTGLTPLRLMELAQRVPVGADVVRPSNETSGTAEAVPLLRSRAARESLHCIGCGLCSYVCPTRLPLTQETLRLRLRVLAATGHTLGISPRRPT
jgi:electron transport complex protein RnfC